MADVNRGNRPLSPHLQIYKPQIQMVSSILTRITGNALIVSALLIVWWLLAAATGPEYFAFVDGLLGSVPGRLVLVLSLWGLCYHALAGLRHLWWDSGRGLELETSSRLGWGVVGGSVLLTALILLLML